MTKQSTQKKTAKFWGVRKFLVINILLILMLAVVTFMLNQKIFYMLLPVMLLLTYFSIHKYIKIHRDVYKFMKNVSKNLKFKNIETLFDLTMPIMSITALREIVWYNDSCRKILNHRDLFGHNLDQITVTPIQEIKKNGREVVKINDKYYHMYITDSETDENQMNFLYFVEMTDLYNIKTEYEQSRPVVMSILLDSYEEIVKHTRESDKIRILSEIHRLLEEYIGETTGFIKSTQQDKYTAVIEYRHYEQMVQDRFSILDKTKNIVTNARVPMTLSIGVSMVGANLDTAVHQARQSLEMALGRGGDQVAVKTEDGFKFFGGLSKGVEKRTKVKSRILASAMSELIESSDNVLIMGHKFADLDSLGSAIGMYAACKSFNKPVKIVMDTQKCLAKPLIDHMYANDEHDLFVNPIEAEQLVRRNTLLFIVDTHSPNLVESAEVCRACTDKVIIDHHRLMVDNIHNPVILFHEPYASSASEMVTELVQYFGENFTLKHYEAEALLAGITLDTKNFIMKTGVRTFEAAAYLKKMGADTIKVKKLFSNTMEAYKDKNQLIADSQMYKNCAIVCTDTPGDDIRLVAPQAADELLWIEGVRATFVLYKMGNDVNLSARSMGKINVQLIMEKLGGGGHQTMAGAQVKNQTTTEVKNRLIDAINEYYSEIAKEK